MYNKRQPLGGVMNNELLKKLVSVPLSRVSWALSSKISAECG